MAITSTARVQVKGQITVPLSIRRKLKLKKGDFVAFVETEEGVLIKPAQILVQIDEEPKPQKKKAA